jgi:hypothetical protein
VLATWLSFFALVISDSPSVAGSCADDVSSGDEAFWTQFECGSSGSASGDPGGGEQAGESPPNQALLLAETGACLGDIEHCLAEPAATISSEVVLAAMRRVQPPRSRLAVQPPGGQTLVNFDTIFSTESEPFRRTVRLLGHEVVLKIWASSFRWQFGDGLALTTDHPGRTYERGLPMDSYITHQYTDADVTVHPSVDTTYSAEYSVDGGPFQPVNGTVTIEGDAAGLRVVEARPVLTGSR